MRRRLLGSRVTQGFRPRGPGPTPKAFNSGVTPLRVVMASLVGLVVWSAHDLTAQDTVTVTSGQSPTFGEQIPLRPTTTVLGHEFGRVVQLVVTIDGGVVVLDAEGESGPEVLRFAATGRLLGSLGRTGNGPGEFGRRPVGGVGPDGFILLLDRTNRRVLRFTPTGEYLSEFRVTGNGSPTAVSGGAGGAIFVRFALPSPNGDGLGRHSVVHYTPRGEAARTLGSGGFGFVASPRDQYSPRELWALTRDGGIVVTGTHDPRILLEGSRAGRVTRIDHRAEPEGFASGEREELLAALEYARRNAPPIAKRQYDLRIPDRKAIYASIHTTIDGSIWLRDHPPGHRIAPVPAFRSGSLEPPPTISFREQPWYSRFDRDGRYRGDVLFPANVRKVAFGTGVAWGVVEDPGGVETVVRFELP